VVYLKPNQRIQNSLKKTGCRALVIVLFHLLVFQGFSQDDSVLFYFNRGNEADISRGETLLEKYSPKDSVKIDRIAARLSNQEKKITFYHAFGDRLYATDDYSDAIRYYSKSLKYARLTLRKELIAKELGALGDMYRLQEQLTTALTLIFEAMYIYKELGNTYEYKNMMGLIGDINRCLDQYDDALKYLNESLLLSIKTNDTKDQAFCYSSIGGTYQSLKKYDEALYSYNKGLSLATVMRDTLRIIDFHYSIGDLMVDMNRVPEAIAYLEEGLRISAPDDRYNQAFCRMGLSRAYLKKGDHKRALEEGLETYRIGKELNDKGFCTEVSEILYQIYAAKNDYVNAYKYLKIVKEDEDSTMNTSSIKQQAQIEINFKNSFEAKKDSLVRFAEEMEKELVHKSELKQQRNVAVAGVLGLIVAIIIVVIVFRSYKKEKRSREIINEQKGIVDAKNKEIVDSINYAKKIQQAIIPTTAEVKSIFPESFVILLPKDIVSGDFYWITEKEDYIFLAAADCTGHGVPGGFMSMLGTALLNEIINDKNIYEPADILDMLKLKIILALRQSDNTNENKDGMDLALIRIDKKKNKLTFSGANNSLYIIRDNKLTEYKGDKHPIGFSFNNTANQFRQVEIEIKKNDVLYMFTDGYPDQFGGPQGKKFKYKPLEQALLTIHRNSMNAQKEELLRVHEQWRGNLEQVDDICLVGVKI
jgi:serine phosphatase RsbU (regulator of sigma subunit)